MSNGTKKNIKIIIPSSLDDEGARMLVIPLLREPVLMQDVYQPNQVMRLLRISKPRFYELTDLKQRNPLPTHNYGPGKRGTIILREELIEWVASLRKGIGNGKPGELQELFSREPQRTRTYGRRVIATALAVSMRPSDIAC